MQHDKAIRKSIIILIIILIIIFIGRNLACIFAEASVGNKVLNTNTVLPDSLCNFASSFEDTTENGQQSKATAENVVWRAILDCCQTENLVFVC